MKRNKAAMIKRRQSLLAVMAVVLILASIGTGYLGFVYDPGEDVPGGSPLPTGVNPVSATATGATEETTVGTETTAPTTVETTEATSVPMEADGVEAAPAKKGGSDKATAPTDEAPATTEAPPATTETPPATTENTPAATEVPPATTEKPAANIEEPPATTEAPIRPASENFDPGDAFPPSSTATEEPPHSGIYINPHTFTQPASEETAPSASEGTTPTVLSEPTSPRKSVPSFRLVMQIACFVFAAGACVDILLLAMLRKNVRDHECSGEQPMEPPTPAEVHPVPITKETVEETVCPIPGISLGKIHDVGRRDYQQDSFGQTAVLRNTGILAVLADGMGGLSGGERVSQKIVMEALTFGSTLQANQVPTALPGMVAGINRAVNQMLGPKGLYTSGSTVVSALITGNALRWISVGDSRVYLYRDGQISQLSRDHDLLQDWMPDILDGKRSMAEALRDPNGRKLTSFIGMGELRHVDYNRTPIPLLPGDRVLLMSDGVYGTVSDAEMAAILRDCGSVQLAASHIGQRIMGAALPYQDNYTLIVLGYDPPDQPRNNR
ncbi:MAG: protein phosphatase 2C domain-containing protein [Oscillospiraceae bacterium]|nr:protein phosphatase 2C domain-containing protein [Oscillospiraceae bacterium]